MVFRNDYFFQGGNIFWASSSSRPRIGRQTATTEKEEKTQPSAEGKRGVSPSSSSNTSSVSTIAQRQELEEERGKEKKWPVGGKKGTFKRNKEKRAKIGLVWETVVCANWPLLEFFFTETEAVSGIGSRSEDFQKKRNPKSRTKKTRKSRNKRVFRRRRTLVWDSKKTAVKMTTKSRKREKSPMHYDVSGTKSEEEELLFSTVDAT